MAKRFYLPVSTAAAVTPAANGSWGDTDEAVNRRMLLAPDTTSTLANGTQIDWTGALGVTALDRRYVSDPLSGAQTISGTVKAYARVFEKDALSNASTRFEAYVVSSDGGTVRGTLLAIGSYGSGAEANLTARNLAFADGDTVTNVNALDGDRIVCCFGYGDATGSGPAATATWGCSHATAIDLPEDETTTTSYNPWVEFSADLVFALDPTARYDTNDAGNTVSAGKYDTIIDLLSDTQKDFKKLSGSDSNRFDQVDDGYGRDACKRVGDTNPANAPKGYQTDGYYGESTGPFPNRGHATIMVEFKTDVTTGITTSATALNQCCGLVCSTTTTGPKSCLVLTSGVLTFRSGAFDSSFAGVSADVQPLSTGVWYIGQAVMRGSNPVASKVDAQTTATTAITAGRGVDWGTTQQLVLGHNTTTSASSLLGTNIRRVVLFGRALNDAELAAARSTYFVDAATGRSSFWWVD